MRIGLDEKTIHSMYRSLARETYEFFGHDPDNILPFSIREIGQWGYNLDFGPTDPSFAATFFTDAGRGNRIVLNQPFIPLSYEDEIIGTLLHEIVHGLLPHSAGHGSLWAMMTEEIGGWHNPMLVLRNHAAMMKFINLDMDWVGLHRHLSYPAVHPFTVPLNF